MFVRFIPACPSLSQKPTNLNYLSKHIALNNYKRKIRTLCTKRLQIPPSTSGDAGGLRVFVLSDLHTDYAENMEWVKSISTARHKKDVLLVAGDVAETYDNFVLTMRLLKDGFEHVFFIPGNHDLWCRRDGEDYEDSLEKLNRLLDACRELEVETNPMVIDGLGIIPIFSWYHESFDREKDVAGIRIPSLEMACKDFHACKWPVELSNQDTSLALYFDAINEKNMNVIKEIQRACSQIITFSHFVPRYVQAPLAYPRERKRRMNGGENWLPFCIFSDGKFADKLSPCYWSDYYSANPRTPHNIELAPWVARFYKQT
ncbi:hypothetical protein F2P56_034357 [Juglans regia]|uniref:Calcineurin-like phosphoesterase domain-containing protein n=2 Tax=Juglans regia TaxID=51240 RepID=A0A833T9L8_JUGRE|nr:uncharacterized protein LOC109000159 isoform X2 [Juglans regia]KAF5445295.1 hypothetical protein F2P56_034357 [Juglans regia]